CVASTVGAFAQPSVAMAFPSELAGRALSAYNLVIFCGVFSVQWGVGLLIDALRATGCGQVVAYQGAFGVYGLCCVLAYWHFLRAK
ncbi:MAG: MFS transporter, partial [Rhodoferax sp.]